MHGRWKLGAGALGTALLAFAGAAAAAGPATASASRAAAPRVASHPLVAVRGTGRIQQSSNWSGYAETGGSYSSVSGSWRVPTDKDTSGTHFSAQWIGIDGDGNQNLIQTGTQVDYLFGFASYGAWWEILPAPETPINEPVAAGDSIHASIRKQANGSWLIRLTDKVNGTTKWTFSTTQSYSGPGTSVEWIVEAPSVAGSIASMGHTGNVTFRNLLVNGKNPQLVAADQIECVQNKVVVESPSLPSTTGNAFTMAYGAKAPKPPA